METVGEDFPQVKVGVMGGARHTYIYIYFRTIMVERCRRDEMCMCVCVCVRVFVDTWIV